MSKKRSVIQFKRRKLGKTNYHHRLSLLKSGKPRLVVRKSSRYIRAQIVVYSPKGDKVVATAVSKELTERGWKYSTKNLPAAYFTGVLCGARAKKAKVDTAILDLGISEPICGSKIYAVMKGVIDAGVKIPHDKKALPSEERLTGGHIREYAKLLAKDKDAYAKQFSAYVKGKADPKVIPDDFKVIKATFGGK